jgi:hypothetical protein
VRREDETLADHVSFGVSEGAAAESWEKDDQPAWSGGNEENDIRGVDSTDEVPWCDVEPVEKRI